MTTKRHAVSKALCGVFMLAAASQAFAQANNTASGGASWIPYTASGYVGFNLGRAEFDTPCGAGLSCDESNTAWRLYTGGNFNQWLGIQFGYLNTGEADRNGGTTRAQGVNLSVVGTFPVSQSFEVFGKAGATYGRTKTTAVGGAPVTAGNKSGWGGSLGVGVAFNFNRNWTAVLEHERHQFRFVNGREGVDLTSLGVKYRF
jgi:OOP family OmpA-OmpF porin